MDKVIQNIIKAINKKVPSINGKKLYKKFLHTREPNFNKTQMYSCFCNTLANFAKRYVYLERPSVGGLYFGDMTFKIIQLIIKDNDDIKILEEESDLSSSDSDDEPKSQFKSSRLSESSDDSDKPKKCTLKTNTPSIQAPSLVGIQSTSSSSNNISVKNPSLVGVRVQTKPPKLPTIPKIAINKNRILSKEIISSSDDSSDDTPDPLKADLKLSSDTGESSDNDEQNKNRKKRSFPSSCESVSMSSTKRQKTMNAHKKSQDFNEMQTLMDKRNIAKIKLTKTQKEFKSKYCKPSLSSEEVDDMFNEYLKIDKLVNSYANLFEGLNSYKIKFMNTQKKMDEAISKLQIYFKSECTRLEPLFTKMEDSFKTLENLFDKSIYERECTSCNSHCLPLVVKNIKKAPGRPSVNS